MDRAPLSVRCAQQLMFVQLAPASTRDLMLTDQLVSSARLTIVSRARLPTLALLVLEDWS